MNYSESEATVSVMRWKPLDGTDLKHLHLTDKAESRSGSFPGGLGGATG